MKTHQATLSLAVLAALGMLVPAAVQAANVGYLPMCVWQGSQGNPSSIISDAGHTPVPVATANAASLSGLSVLMVSNCNGGSLSSQLNPDIAAAVSGGMKLMVYDWNPGSGTGALLPGAPVLNLTGSYGADINIPPGSPVASGPGGTLDNSSLDGGNWSYHGYATAPLPPGATALLTTGNSSQIVAFSYAHGSGAVVYSAMPLDYYIPGGGGGGNYAAFAVATRVYVTNLTGAIAGPTTTCASEGYTGTKLTWCKNICENGLTGAALDTWIHRWVNRYRDLPYCAVEGNVPQPE